LHQKLEVNRFSMEFSQILTDEHKAIRRALDVLRVMTDEVEQGTWPERHDVNALLLFLHYFVDACHQAKEESILFPALRSAKQGASVEPDHLFKEHNEQRGLIEETQLTLFTDKTGEFVANARKLIGIISGHAQEEERVLIPAAEQILTPEKADEVAEQMRQADARFGFTQRRLLFDMLQQLEDKYISKAA
jgi:hemerythrin-like domain-containing protein